HARLQPRVQPLVRLRIPRALPVPGDAEGEPAPDRGHGRGAPPVAGRRDASSPLFLVGFMASGKTTVGRALAATLGFAFEDTDAIVERVAGRSIDAIVRTAGD